MIVGVTGHRFYDEPTAEFLAARVHALLRDWAGDREVRVVSSLAEGADQLVARVAVELGLPLDVVLPSAGYRASLEPQFRAEFDALLAHAATVTRLDHDEPAADAYLEAGLEVLDRSDVLIAVWDGEQARGTGGTAEIVAAARARGIDVVVLWPEGYDRDHPG
jgi:hypothetical protein